MIKVLRNLAILMSCISSIATITADRQFRNITERHIALLKRALSKYENVDLLNGSLDNDSSQELSNRKRRQNDIKKGNGNEETSNESSFDKDDIGWSIINEEVDMVIPMVLTHLQELKIEHLQLPDMKETITLSPLFLTYEAGLFLNNGIVYNVAGVQRHGDAYMTYEGKSFLTRFHLLIKDLQFEYNFLLKFMPIEGGGKVIGSLDDTIVFAELAIGMPNLRLKLNDFRIISFRHINVQLDQQRLIREITGLILTPITNLFRERITTSISDGLKDQMQLVMDDFNNNDPLELRSFSKTLLAGLTGSKKD